MANHSIVGCNNKEANNSEGTNFNMLEEPQRRES